MRRHALVCFGWTLLFFTSVFGETYQSEHFIIHSDLDPHYVQFVQVNAEAYYKNMVPRYFRKGWHKPLIIYYSRTHSDTFKLLCEHGLKHEYGNQLKARHS